MGISQSGVDVCVCIAPIHEYNAVLAVAHSHVERGASRFGPNLNVIIDDVVGLRRERFVNGPEQRRSSHTLDREGVRLTVRPSASVAR